MEGILHMGVVAHELDPETLKDPSGSPLGELRSPLGLELGAEIDVPVGRGGDSNRDRLPLNTSLELSLSTRI